MYSFYTKKLWTPRCAIAKLLLIMRLTTIILITTIMQVSASSFAQKITLSENNSSLVKIFDQIRLQSGVDFVVSMSILNDAKPISIHVKDKDLKSVLNQVFKNQNLDYAINDKFVVVKKKRFSFLNQVVNAFNAVDVRGRVVDESGEPLVGASVRVKGTTRVINTNNEGRFTMNGVEEKAVLEISFIGYKTVEVLVKSELGVITMKVASDELDEIKVTANTGYEEIPLERATGSFEIIDNKALNRSLSMDVLSRLENVATGTYFYNGDNSFMKVGTANNQPRIYIHGISTLEGGAIGRNNPLIILDNFPYEGDLNDINPNEIENITILKDAAAASIWGAKAGNGVIVITSKKAKYDQRLNLTFNASTNIHGKPRLFEKKRINTSDVIDTEIFLYEQGYYNNKINNRAKPALPPVVEILLREKAGELDEMEAKRQIDAYRGQDVRNDMLKYMFRNPVHQQYALGVSGGTQKYKYVLNAGYDRSLSTKAGDKMDRLTLRIDNQFKPIKGLEVRSNLRIGNSNSSSSDVFNFFSDTYEYPYVRLADNQGNSLPVPKDYRMAFLDTAGGGKLLDWQFRPVDEVKNPLKSSTNYDIMLNTSIKYQILSWLSADVSYQFARDQSNTRTHYNLDHYYTRNQINRGTQIKGDLIEYHVPFGGTLTQNHSLGRSSNGRAQLNIKKEWNSDHNLYSIVGVDIQERMFSSNGHTLNGYNDDLLTFASNTDYGKRYPIFGNLAADGMVGYPVIATPPSETINRFVSYYANASYVYKNRYTVSASARKDASNLFGVNTNNKWTPLWSAGLAWNILDEPFLNWDKLSQLKLRATYGYSGNVDNSMTALTTIVYDTNLPETRVIWPKAYVGTRPNPELRWEKVGNFNVGLDLALKDPNMTVTLDVYKKQSIDLFSSFPLDPATGVLSMTLNVANVESKGIDIRINRDILNQTSFKWNTNFLFTYNNSWITKTYRDYIGPSTYVRPDAISFDEGTMAFAAYSYRWAGLDPQTGAPRGYLNGEISKDYSKITSKETTLDELKLHGSGRPLYYGSLLNTFSYNEWSLSFTLNYQLGYYFRREGMDYDTFFAKGTAHSDYYQRWQKPGDESITHVPAFVYPQDRSASFYKNSEVLMERGDHIRLQDLRLAYQLSQSPRIGLKNSSVYIHTTNLGLLWTANKFKIDPATGGGIPMPVSVALGLNLNF